MKYYLVGGYVRDELLGIKSKDIDFAVEATDYWEMREDILAKGYTVWQERPEFLSIRAKHPELGPADFTVCRKDGFYSDARHPDIVHVGDIYDDLARRDFTVNAIARSEGFPTYYDPFGGMHDLKTKTLRCVGRAKERFEEDALRILRAMRFHIVRGFKLDPEIEQELSTYTTIDLLDKIPVERCYEELKKCFEYNTWETLRFTDSHKVLKYKLFLDLKIGLEPQIG